MSAFDFLTNTTKFLTFSGTTGVDFSWDVAEARGSDYSIETEGSFEGSWEYDGNFGFEIGRRLTGPVHAVSKKLLEVTPEALEERGRARALEERRKLMAEGFDKLQKALNEKVAAREAVQAVNQGLKEASYFN